jgi:hypothetical protein
MGEKVADEFSSLATVSSGVNDKTTSPKFSLFGSLMGGKAKEDPVFSGRNPSLTVIEEEQSGHSSEHKEGRGLGLKNERVLDDMALFNSLVSITSKEEKGEMKDTTGWKKLGFAGLKDEKVDDGEVDAALLGFSSNALKSVKGPTAKPTIRSTLSQESVDVDHYDDQLLRLLSASATSKGATPKTSTSLSQEAVDVDKHDDQLLRLLSSSAPLKTAKQNSSTLLSQEAVDVEKYDNQILNLPSAGARTKVKEQQLQEQEGRARLKDEGIDEDSRDEQILFSAKRQISEPLSQSPPTPLKDSQKTLSQSMAGSTLTSPFMAGRHRLSSKRESKMDVPKNYLGKYRSTSPPPEGAP